jgi:hypothetical protein
MTTVTSGKKKNPRPKSGVERNTISQNGTSGVSLSIAAATGSTGFATGAKDGIRVGIAA